MTSEQIYNYLTAGVATFSLVRDGERFDYGVRQYPHSSYKFGCFYAYPGGFDPLGSFVEDVMILRQPYYLRDQPTKEFSILRDFLRDFSTATIVPGNRCAKCGKLLTGQKSLELGLGRICAKKIKGDKL